MAERAVTIRDVGPRDGLQAEAPVDPQRRLDLAVALAGAGVGDIEAASFVSPRAVPAMAGAADVFAALPALDSVCWWALVPNRRGAELAMDAGVKAVTFTVSASAAYSAKNVGMTPQEGVAALGEIAGVLGAQDADIRLDTVISYSFGSPFGDVPDVGVVAAMVDQIRAAMPGTITLADTTGTATPRRVAAVLNRVGTDVGLHLHDTRGIALSNALAALDLGVRRFDTSVGGLGGSPFAPGAGGNLATEDLVLVLEDGGIDTGIDLDALLRISRGLSALVGHDVPSRTSAAGPVPSFAD